MMQLTDKPRRSPQAVYEIVEGETIILKLTNKSYTYTLNDTGTVFWELLDGQRTIADCAQLIAQEYDVELSEVETDLLELADEIKREGLLVV